MALRGKGMLITFTDVKPRDERDFNEWYNREHIDERVNLPGFRRARRYVAADGQADPRYMATYECDTVGDLATRRYLKLLANQTPWTQRVMARFTRFHRLTLRIRADLAHGVGGAVTCVRFVPDPAMAGRLATWLRRVALPAAIERPGMVGGFAASNELDVANAPARAQGVDYPQASTIEWAVVLEGAAAATAAASRATLSRRALAPFGVTGAPIVGTYTLLFGNER
ncbi:hypothetical protein FHP25_29825 [Vineibacter terrae]|uniref:EthD domain-containing protein n=1 Tax=Vineibacter terrae TaxID=2586908 RepID=A0A5C8PCB1_9HYPH|nr:DUF4286 family protein [Vineibacter terrae]TXL71431.1 hypothetical protein FHP25_29825 [Vineibacter terrae]